MIGGAAQVLDLAVVEPLGEIASGLFTVSIGFLSAVARQVTTGMLLTTNGATRIFPPLRECSVSDAAKAGASGYEK
jgi:hypothetical protein